jgi:hypothetical protein
MTHAARYQYDQHQHQHHLFSLKCYTAYYNLIIRFTKVITNYVNNHSPNNAGPLIAVRSDFLQVNKFHITATTTTTTTTFQRHCICHSYKSSIYAFLLFPNSSLYL